MNPRERAVAGEPRLASTIVALRSAISAASSHKDGEQMIEAYIRTRDFILSCKEHVHNSPSCAQRHSMLACGIIDLWWCMIYSKDHVVCTTIRTRSNVQYVTTNAFLVLNGLSDHAGVLKL
jgi:hypothetical protein